MNILKSFLTQKYGISPYSDHGGIFEVDVVYTWVDGSDPEHHNQVLKYSSTFEYCRYAQFGELSLSLKTIEQFAPWVRRIFIVVADYQVFDTTRLSPWLQKRVECIRHSQVIPTQYLPVFASQVIESYIHKIPGLADRYIYFNDDMFLGAPVTLNDFFDELGRPYMLIDRSMSYFRSPLWFKSSMNSRQWGFYNSIYLFTSAYNLPSWDRYRFYKKTIHQPHPTLKQIAELLWEIPEISHFLTVQNRHRFRSNFEVGFNYLMSLCGLHTDQVKMRIECDHVFFSFFNEGSLDAGLLKIKTKRPKFVCANNTLAVENKSLGVRFITNLEEILCN